MSIQALVWVIEYSQSRLADRCVLVSIANHCDRQGKNAWPSVDTISHEAKVSPRQVQLSIARLSKIGELSVARNQGPHGTNLYGLPMVTEGNPSLLTQIPESDSGGAKSSGVQNLRGANSSPGAQNPAPKTQNSAPEPFFESSFEPSSTTPLPPNGAASGKIAAKVSAGKLNGEECRNLFERFWNLYPRPYSKHRTWAQWRSLNPTPEMLDAIIEDFTTRQQFQAWTRENGRFIPNSENYLKSRTWLDWSHPRAVPPPAIKRYLATHQAAIAERRQTPTRNARGHGSLA